MITIKYLKQLKPHTIFAKGKTIDNPSGINVANTDKVIKWVAVRGGIHDWAIFTDNPYTPQETFNDVKAWGDKLHNETFIRKLVPCDNKTFALYNH